MFSSIFSRFSIEVVVFILCEKKGNFLYFFKTLISTFSQIKIKTYIKMLRYLSLHLDLMNPCLKWDELCVMAAEISMLKKILAKRFFLGFTDLYFSEFPMHFFLVYIIV